MGEIVKIPRAVHEAAVRLENKFPIAPWTCAEAHAIRRRRHGDDDGAAFWRQVYGYLGTTHLAGVDDDDTPRFVIEA